MLEELLRAELPRRALKEELLHVHIDIQAQQREGAGKRRRDAAARGDHGVEQRERHGKKVSARALERIMEQIEKQLNKKIDVIKVRRFAENKCVTRELLMLKVTYTNVTRSDIMEICNITGAHIADLSPKSMVIELTAKTSKIDRFIKLMQPFGIIEMARTGALAVQRDSNE